MTATSTQLSSLARHALSWQHQHSLPASAVMQTSQTVCSMLLQEAVPCTSSAEQHSAAVQSTAVSSSGHSKRHKHDKQVQLIYNAGNQDLPAWSAMPSSSQTAVCLLDRLRHRGHSPYSTHQSMQAPSHIHPILSQLQASTQHVRHISSSAACWRPPQNQDTFHARALPPRPMYQSPRGGFAQDERAVPAQASRQEPQSERQRPPFQRSSPPHARQPGGNTVMNVCCQSWTRTAHL